MNTSPSNQPLKPSPLEFHIRTELAETSFYEFVQQAWHVLEPATPFVDGIHVRAICDHLQAVTEGRIKNLIINLPPGHAKSLIAAVMWPAWVWIRQPESRWLFSSYKEDLALRDSLKCRRLLESDWYRSRWGQQVQLRKDQNEKGRFENSASGYRVVVPIGPGTGERGDYIVVDDPHSVEQATSDGLRRKAIDWWLGSMSTRLNDLNTGHKVVIQQRVHEADLTGELLRHGGYDWLCLPAEFEQERRCQTSIGWEDPRTQPGELLWPLKITKENLEDQKATLGSYHYVAQYQQRPAPADGGIFKRHWLRFWSPRNIDLPPVEVKTPDGETCLITPIPVPKQFDNLIQSWDMAFKDLDTSDYVVGQVWGAKGADRYLLDQVRKRLDMPGTKQAIKDLTRRWPKTTAKLVEDRANGPAVIQELQHDISGLIPVNPEGGKIARAQAVAPQIEAGNVYLPHPQTAPWVLDLIEELTSFPRGRHDDQVDALTQALNRLRDSNPLDLPPESEITIPDFSIPESWPLAYAMVVQRDQVYVMWAARDPSDGTIYLCTEYLSGHPAPKAIAKTIMEIGDWIPGLIYSGDSTEKVKIAWMYQQLGLNLDCISIGNSALMQFQQLVHDDKLRVFSCLTGFLEEYRAGDAESPLMLCAQALIARTDRMSTKRELDFDLSCNWPSGGSSGWMRG